MYMYIYIYIYICVESNHGWPCGQNTSIRTQLESLNLYNVYNAMLSQNKQRIT